MTYEHLNPMMLYWYTQDPVADNDINGKKSNNIKRIEQAERHPYRAFFE